MGTSTCSELSLTNYHQVDDRYVHWYRGKGELHKLGMAYMIDLHLKAKPVTEIRFIYMP